MGFQLGDMGMPDADDDDDDDLEAELQRLQQGHGGGAASKANKRSAGLLFHGSNG